MKKNILFVCALIICFSLSGQSPEEKYAKDVATIDGIINAYYEVISGSSQDPWQFERDKYIHAPNAVITRLSENGEADVHSLEAEYIPMGLSPKEDFYEKELKRDVSQFGHMAQVWSAYEIRMEANIASDMRGLNSIQLHFENGRWWIDSWTCEIETVKNPIVTEFLKKE